MKMDSCLGYCFCFLSHDSAIIIAPIMRKVGAAMRARLALLLPALNSVSASHRPSRHIMRARLVAFLPTLSSGLRLETMWPLIRRALTPPLGQVTNNEQRTDFSWRFFPEVNTESINNQKVAQTIIMYAATSDDLPTG